MTGGANPGHRFEERRLILHGDEASGGADELIDHGTSGLLVPSRSPEAIATAIIDLLADPAGRLEIGATARRRAESEFSLPSFMGRYEQMYVALAADRAGRDARRHAEVHA